MKNEKYQQALESINEKTFELRDVLDIEDETNTLQELVDMMKPLEFEEIEVGFMNTNHYYVFDSETKDIFEVTAIHNDPKTLAVKLTYEPWLSLLEFEENRFYRNIWELE